MGVFRKVVGAFFEWLGVSGLLRVGHFVPDFNLLITIICLIEDAPNLRP